MRRTGKIFGIFLIIVCDMIIATILTALIFTCKHDNVHRNIIKEPTCISNGQVNVVCAECQTVLESRIWNAKGHKFGEYELTVMPKKNKDGLETRVCADCEAIEARRYICPHSNLKIITTPPSCTQRGTKEVLCAACETTIDLQYGAMLECAYGDWTITKQPTCIDRGVKQRVCIGCGNVEEMETDFADCKYLFSFNEYDSDTGKNTRYYKCMCGNQKSEEESVYANFYGTLWIESVDLVVNLYNGGAQSICDRQNSACYFSYLYLGRARNVKLIADHWNQGFDKIKSCKIGDIATIGDEGYRCIDIFTGHNCESYLSDDDYRDITTRDGDLFMYTCNDHWRNVTIVAWEKI